MSHSNFSDVELTSEHYRCPVCRSYNGLQKTSHLTDRSHDGHLRDGFGCACGWIGYREQLLSKDSLNILATANCELDGDHVIVETPLARFKANTIDGALSLHSKCKPQTHNYLDAKIIEISQVTVDSAGGVDRVQKNSLRFTDVDS